MTRNKKLLLLSVLAIHLSSCAILSPPPIEVSNVCQLFKDKKSWYHAGRQAENRWKIPMTTILAFIQQESSFKYNARPQREKLFGFIPWQRPTSAYGYAQATSPAWEDYKKATGQALVFRNNFKDAADFIGWYNNRSANTLNIPRNDTHNLYLAYHEGIGGYRKKSYLQKPWLKKVAQKVHNQEKIYTKQLNSCRT